MKEVGERVVEEIEVAGHSKCFPTDYFLWPMDFIWQFQINIDIDIISLFLSSSSYSSSKVGESLLHASLGCMKVPERKVYLAWLGSTCQPEML